MHQWIIGTIALVKIKSVVEFKFQNSNNNNDNTIYPKFKLYPHYPPISSIINIVMQGKGFENDFINGNISKGK